MAHDDRTQTNRDQQGSALVHTKDMEHFDIPDGQPDPRGWSVKSADGTTIGKVEDLLVDTGEGRVRYLEVKTDGDISKKGGRDYFLLPIGSARLDDEHDDVVLNMGAEDLTAVPAYERGKLSRDYETSLRDYVRGRPGTERATTAGAVGAGTVGAGAADREVSFYGSPEYDDASFFSRGRNRTTGAMGASSGAADRATSSGLGDRITDKLDDLKDRVDGNPASRPGPDPTDRRI